MPRVSLPDIRSLPDIIDTTGYLLVLGNVPGAGDTRDLTLKCLNTNIPGFSNEAFEVPLHGHVVKFRGRKMYTRTLSITYVEDARFNTHRKLRQWHELIVGTESGDSASDKADYAVNGTLQILNHKGETINSMTIFSIFPQDIPDVQLSGESSQFMQVAATFSFDYFKDDVMNR